jgi:hypothetical protein
MHDAKVNECAHDSCPKQCDCDTDHRTVKPQYGDQEEERNNKTNLDRLSMVSSLTQSRAREAICLFRFLELNFNSLDKLVKGEPPIPFLIRKAYSKLKFRGLYETDKIPPSPECVRNTAAGPHRRFSQKGHKPLGLISCSPGLSRLFEQSHYSVASP